MPSTTSKNPPESIQEQKQRVTQLVQGRRLPEAKNLCTELCDIVPDDPEAWMLLGAILGELSELPEAEACCRKALTMSPEHPALAFNLAVILINSGKETESINFLETCIKHRPEFADAYRKLADVQSRTGNSITAIKNYKKAIALDPESAITHFSLAKIYRELNQLDEAILHYRKSIQLKPDFYDAYIDLAIILHSQSRFSEIIQILQPAIGNFPNAEAYHFKLALAYHEQGDSDIALKYYEKTLELNEDNIDARRGMAGMLGLQGKYARACEHLEEIIYAHPDNIAAVIMYAEFAEQTGKIDEAVKLVTDNLNTRNYSSHTGSGLHFSLAHLYECKNDPDLAFRHYEQGNQLKQSTFDYKAYEKFYNDIATAFSASRLERFPHAGNESATPIFIVGMPRSGTSLVEQILASHPDVYGAGELRVMNNIARKLAKHQATKIPYIYSLDDIGLQELGLLAEEYLEELSIRSGGSPRVTDKMPFNFIHLGLIDLLFSRAIIIHCERDPLDTCLSCYFSNFSGEHPFTNDLTEVGRYYNIYHRLMAHWRQVLRLPIHAVKYEQLVLNQEAETRRLVELCGLDWHNACLQFDKTDRTVSTASHGQVRRPLYTGSIGKWRNYEKFLDPLFNGLNLQRH